ncbi:hypothetical protein KORDIASMS9_03850 [Kordia sp. SMS9]|uniref:hypothetical protein n=1 Tax=Kordia sp. SMS9 TaxID=2282170 RepID=UPI000E10BC43|nr:hypothetical protein [Kordia sp. SMS9]AXG71593.1 hypothetical protein KORDIASMS9_03850 [Kordia sp. SMS9]
MFEKLKKLSRLNKLEIIIVLIAVFSIMTIFDSRSRTNFNPGLTLSACLALIVWIEIHRENNKKK